MTPQLPPTARQVEHRWLSPLLPSLVAAVCLMATLAAASLVAAAECRVTDLIHGGTIQDMPTSKGTTSSLLPVTLTVDRDFYGGLVPSPVPQVLPYRNNSRIVLGKTEHQGMATIGACSSRDLRKSPLVNRAMFRSIVKSPTNAHAQFMNVPALLYNGKRPSLMIRTTPPEFGIVARYKADTLIGPVQDSWQSVFPDNRPVTQAIVTRPSTVEPFSPFGSRPSLDSNLFQHALERPDNESLRMNLTTEHVLQGGN